MKSQPTALDTLRFDSEQFARKASVHHAIERNRCVVTESGRDACLEFLEHHPGDGGHVETCGFFDRYPDEFDELRVRADNSIDTMHDGARIRGKETRVESLGPSRRRDRARDEVQTGEIGLHARLRECGPWS